MLSLGLDPGWKNFGQALVQSTDNPWKVNIVSCESLDISNGPENFVESLCTDVDLGSVRLERYVAYANVRTGEAENITQVIGMIRMKYYLINKQRKIIIPTGTPHSSIDISLVRAIEWKTKLVQLLSKYCEFYNPSMDLDKKFSLAAAKHVAANPELIRNDHIADAVCIAALSVFERRLAVPE